MRDKLRIAIAQTLVTTDPRANGPAIRAQMREAAAAGARLVQFTEGAMSGYVGQDKPGYTGWPVDWAALREEMEETAALAGELGIWALIGSNHPLTPPHRPHNSLYLISDEGALSARYDKRLLSFSEVSDFYAPGIDPLIFEIDGYRFGCVLCIEIQFPELFVAYARDGVDAVLLSTFSRDPMFAIQAQGHAACGAYWIGYSVPAQYSAAAPSGLVGPNGRWIAQASADGKPALAIADIDPSDETLRIGQEHARPWREQARIGEVFSAARVHDPRSTNRTSF